MRILHCAEHYSPSTGGIQEAVRQISEGLVRGGHDVTVATSRHSDRENLEINGVKVREFDITGNQVRGYRGDIDRYRHFLEHQDFDILTLFAAQQWSADLAFPLLSKMAGRNVFVPTGFSALRNKYYHSYFEAMPGWMRQCDAHVFQSETYQDIQFARQNNISPLYVIPNGASEKEFAPMEGRLLSQHLGIPEKAFLIVHVGSFLRDKGQWDAIRIFRRAGLQKATLLCIGNPASARFFHFCRLLAFLYNREPGRSRDHNRILMTSLTRADTVCALQNADLFLFPSRRECSPIVLFEAAASRTPFLATDVGNAAEIAAWTGDGQILPTSKDGEGRALANIEESARILWELCNDRDHLQRMGEEGQRVWKEKFTWESIAKQYERLYADVCGIRSPIESRKNPDCCTPN